LGEHWPEGQQFKLLGKSRQDACRKFYRFKDSSTVVEEIGGEEVLVAIPNDKFVELFGIESPYAPKFEQTSCSQCGREFGPGDHGYSHCADHGLSNDAKDRIKQAISNEERPTASSKHTPGPWHMGAGNGEGGIFADDGRMRFENGTTLYPIASVNRGWNDAEDDANARLIAASPELLSALESMSRLSKEVKQFKDCY
jgi:hypothetical protein